jgi:hypothetical protein
MLAEFMACTLGSLRALRVSFSSLCSCGTLFVVHALGYGKSPCFSCSWSSMVAILDYGRLFCVCPIMAIMRGCA